MVGTIPRPFIDELIARCDIVEIIDARVPLRKKGNNFVACCPFHQEKTPSFVVTPTKQFYHCFGCGVSGNVLSFLMDFEHLNFPDAVEQLAHQLGVPIPQEFSAKAPVQDIDGYALLEKIAGYYQQQLRHSPAAIDYLKSRGLSGQIVKEFGVGYVAGQWENIVPVLKFTEKEKQHLVKLGMLISKSTNNFYDRFRERIMFPIRDRRGRVIGFGGRILEKGEPKYLNSPESPIFHKGKELYGLFEAAKFLREIPRLLVVEGYMDVIALAQFGIRNVVATLGTAITGDHLHQLLRVTPEVVFCFDGDKAGQTAAWRALEISLPSLQDGFHVRFLILPEGEDPDSMVRKEGVEQFNQRIEQAISLGDFLFAKLSEKIDIKTSEGKAHFSKLARPLIEKIPQGVLQELLLARLAQFIRMDLETLKQLQKKPEKTFVKTFTPQKTNSVQKRSPMRMAIALLVQFPQLAQSLEKVNEVLGLQLPGSQWLKDLLMLLNNSPELTTGGILEQWRDHPDQKQLAQLATMDIPIPQSGLEQEFLGTIDRLIKIDFDQQIEQLLDKANIESLTEAEKQKLQELIAKAKEEIS